MTRTHEVWVSYRDGKGVLVSFFGKGGGRMRQYRLRMGSVEARAGSLSRLIWTCDMIGGWYRPLTQGWYWRKE